MGPAASQTTPSTYLITASPAQITMTAPRHSRQEKLLFSGQKDDFPTEQFEARGYALGLSVCLLDRIKTTPQKHVETNDERVKRERGKKQIEPNYSTWCGASWFSALTRQASTSSEGTSQMGLQPGQL